MFAETDFLSYCHGNRVYATGVFYVSQIPAVISYFVFSYATLYSQMQDFGLSVITNCGIKSSNGNCIDVYFLSFQGFPFNFPPCFLLKCAASQYPNSLSLLIDANEFQTQSVVLVGGSKRMHHSQNSRLPYSKMERQWLLIREIKRLNINEALGKAIYKAMLFVQDISTTRQFKGLLGNKPSVLFLIIK